MEFVEITSDLSKEMSEYLYPIWHEVFDGMMPEGPDAAEYIFQKWTNPEAIQKSIDDGYVYGYVEVDGSRVGLYSYHIRDDGRFYVNKIYLESKFRGKGYGKEALYKMFEIARENSCSEVFLNVYYLNKRAIETYHKCGMELWYRCLGWIGNGLTRNDYLMRMKL